MDGKYNENISAYQSGGIGFNNVSGVDNIVEHNLVIGADVAFSATNSSGIHFNNNTAISTTGRGIGYYLNGNRSISLSNLKAIGYRIGYDIRNNRDINSHNLSALAPNRDSNNLISIRSVTELARIVPSLNLSKSQIISILDAVSDLKSELEDPCRSKKAILKTASFLVRYSIKISEPYSSQIVKQFGEYILDLMA